MSNDWSIEARRAVIVDDSSFRLSNPKAWRGNYGLGQVGTFLRSGHSSGFHSFDWTMHFGHAYCLVDSDNENKVGRLAVDGQRARQRGSRTVWPFPLTRKVSLFQRMTKTVEPPRARASSRMCPLCCCCTGPASQCALVEDRHEARRISLRRHIKPSIGTRRGDYDEGRSGNEATTEPSMWSMSFRGHR